MVSISARETPVRPPPPAISSRDEVGLIWMFNEGAAALEKSNFGAVLERSELFAYRSIRCGTCAGLGILSASDSAGSPAWSQMIEADDGTFRKAKAGDWCPDCDGTGSDYDRGHEYSTAITAQPKGIAEPGGGYEAGHHDLERYAQISRRLVRVERESAALLGVLSQLYGGAGERCVSEGHYGRLLPVMAATIPGGDIIKNSNERRAPKAEQGRRSVKTAKPGSGQLRRDYTDRRDVGWEPLHRPGDQVLLTEIIADRGQPRPERTKLIRKASEAAARLAQSARCLYADSLSQSRRKPQQPQGGPCVTTGCEGQTMPPPEAPSARPQCPLCGRYEPRGEAARQLGKGGRDAR